MSHAPVSGECTYRQDLLRNVGKIDQRVLARKSGVDAHARERARDLTIETMMTMIEDLQRRLGDAPGNP